MKNKTVLTELWSIIGEKPSNPWDTCYRLLSLIESKDESQQEMCFTVLLKDIDMSDCNLSTADKSFDTRIHSRSFTEIWMIVTRLLQNLIRSDLPESTFYSRLWQFLNNKDLFIAFEDRVSVLTVLWSDSRMPYYRIDEGLLMDNGEFQNIANHLHNEIQSVQRVINSRKPQRTQTVSLFMNIADSIPDIRAKTVFWAIAISLYSNDEYEIKQDTFLNSLPDQLREQIKTFTDSVSKKD